MKTFVLAMAATLATSMAMGAPRDRQPREPRRPGPVQPQPGRPAPGRPAPAPGRPPADEIVRLGGTRLSPIADADTIQVNSCGAGEQGRISDLKIVSVKHSAALSGIRVTYGNGVAEDIGMNMVLRPGQSTRWIDLLGGGRGRCVRSVRVFGSSRSIGFKQATIDIYGRRTWRSQLDLQDRREEN